MLRHKRARWIGTAIWILCLLLLSCLAPAQSPQRLGDVQAVHFEASDENFLNPERGFHRNTDLLQTKDLRWVREQGFSLVRAYVRLDAFRDSPFTPEFLEKLDAGFAVVRAAGIKVLPIFAYNFPTDEDIRSGRVKNSPDAPLPLVLQHLQQLKPVLANNQDVIAALELGFVGAWGEWHSSKNGLDSPKNKSAILKGILDALPKSRMMQLRYPADLMANYPNPLTEKQAFSGSNQARTGWANMCFLSNESDSGTYLPLSTKEEKQKYLERMSWYVVVGGETCQITPEQSRADCATALKEFQRFHFSYLNHDFYPPTIARWKQDGCFETIEKRLGYRLRLIEAAAPRQAKPGAPLPFRFFMANDGWASPYNARKVELILRSKADGRVVRFPVQTDPRRWYPGTEKYRVDGIAKLPSRMQEGEYELLLNLPDPLPSLIRRPEYSIRLANQNTWEEATGFNRLLMTITVSR